MAFSNELIFTGLALIVGGSVLCLHLRKRESPCPTTKEVVCRINQATGNIKKIQDLLRLFILKEYSKNDLFGSILETIILQVEAKRASIWLLQGQGDMFLAASHVYQKGDSAAVHHSLEDAPRASLLEGLAGHAVIEREKVNVEDASQDERFSQDVDGIFEPNKKVSMLYVPIISGESVKGLIQITRETGEGAFSEADEEFVDQLAIICTIVLDRDTLTHEAKLAHRKADALLEVMRSSCDGESLYGLLYRVSKSAQSLLLADRVTLFLVDQLKKQLFFSVVHDTSELQNHVVPLGQGIVGFVASTGEIVNIKNAYQDDRFDRSIDKTTGYTTKSILCMPVFSFRQNKPVAVIEALNKQSGDCFTKADTEAMEGFCFEVGKLLSMKTMETFVMKNDIALQMEDPSPSKMGAEFLTQYMPTARRSSTPVGQRLSLSTPNRRRSSLLPLYLSMPSPNEALVSDSPMFSHIKPIQRQGSTDLMSFEDLQSLDEWDLDVHSLSEEKMNTYVFCIFTSVQPPEGAKVDQEKIHNFIQAVRQRYRNNAFHNWQHAFSVCHMSYLLLKKGELNAFLNPAAVYGTLIAAICHDLDHPGNDNRFESNQRSELSIMFADDSVLERHHLHVCRKILTKEENNFFNEFSEDDQAEVYDVIRQAILGTDMVHHFDHITKLTQRLHSVQQQVDNAFDPDNPNDRALLASMIVHAADLSGQCHKEDIALEWGRRIAAEFTEQSKREDKLGLPITTFMKELDDNHNFFILQFNFLANIVFPFWDVFGKLFPSLIEMVDALQKNIEYFEKKAQSEVSGSFDS